MLKAEWTKYELVMKRPSRTSREVITVKPTYFVRIYDSEAPQVAGYGEAAPFRGLSADDTPDFEALLEKSRQAINDTSVADMPSSAIRFAFESALSDLRNGGRMRPFDTADSFSVPINGLVWMGDRDFMTREAAAKLAQGFRCLKFKIGGIDFDEELAILGMIRDKMPPEVLEIRLDANGSFTPQNALQRLERLSKFNIHSLEQPIKQHQPEAMADICRNSPIPTALDEELIGITPDVDKRQLLEFVRPQYIILKPTLCGGFDEADRWIAVAEALGIGWWATSALESDIGLNAIARWVSCKQTAMPQGLGTGQLYTNNIASPLAMDGPRLTSRPSEAWNLSSINGWK